MFNESCLPSTDGLRPQRVLGAVMGDTDPNHNGNS